MSTRALKRKLWINLALVAAVGALVILVMLEPGKESPAPPTPLTHIDAASVSSIRIEAPDSAAIRLQRSSDGWRLVEPRELPANAGKLDNLLAITGAESLRRYEAGELDAGAVGFDDQSPSLTLDDTRFVFGGTDPINGWRYVRVGDTVHLVNDRFIHLVRQGPLHWADNRLLPEMARVNALAMPDRRVYRDDQGRWQSEPALPETGADALVSLVQRWEEARGLSVKPLEGAIPEAAPAIDVTLESGETLTFRLLEPGDGLFLARPDLGLRYAITGAQREDLLNVTTGESPHAGGNEAPGDGS